MNSDDSPEEPHFRSELSVLSPASPKPLHFPTPTNIPVLNNMMDVDYNQTELHMQNPAMRNTELRDGAWKEADAEAEVTGESSIEPGTAQTQKFTDGEEVAQSVTEHVTAPIDTHAATIDEIHGATSTPQVVAGNLDAPTTQQAVPNDVLTGHADSTATATATTEQSAPVKPQLATDAETFLSQIQNIALPFVHDTNPLSTDAQHVENQSSLSNNLPASEHNFVLQSERSNHNGVQPTFAAAAALDTGRQSALSDAEHSNNTPVQAPLIVANQNVPDLASFFPSGNLPADLAASLMQGAAMPFTANAPFPHRSSNNVTPLESQREKKLAAGEILTPDDAKWTADVQQKYDEFIQDERRYVNEGRWDSFPHGSRLFVGNLSSESVTKRDIFHVFHSYGKLAQISIKQAFGFVQFLSTEDCMRALEREQGRSIKDKKIHLEISKPQKPRNQGNNRERRSRSPEVRDAGRGDRYSGGGRNERNARRGGRSPSPRGHRDRYDDRYRRRSRTPPTALRARHHERSPSPVQGRGYDDLPLPKRRFEDIPEVQFMATENVSREFISWAEKAFVARNIRVAVLILDRRLDPEAVVRRQILEGVLAVARLTEQAQGSGKIDLQVFDRSGGGSNIRFEEYRQQDPGTCAELVVRARSAAFSTQYGYAAAPSFAPPTAPPAQYGYAPPQVVPQYNAMPQYAPPPPQAHAVAQYALPPAPPYGNLRPVQHGSAPPQLPQGGYPGFGPPQPMPPMGYPGSTGSMPPMPPQQSSVPGPQQGGLQGPPVDMQQILARLGNYNK